jgi:hypothetical protein
MRHGAQDLGTLSIQCQARCFSLGTQKWSDTQIAQIRGQTACRLSCTALIYLLQVPTSSPHPQEFCMSFASVSDGNPWPDRDSMSDAPNPANVSVSNAPSPVPASVVPEQVQLGVTMEIRVYDITKFADIKLTLFQDSVPPPRAPPKAKLTGPPPVSPPEEKSPNITQQPMVCFRPSSFD